MNFPFQRIIVVALFAVAINSILIGCGQKEVVAPYEPEEYEGSIDTSLSKSVQNKQDAIIRLFTAIQEVGIDQTKVDCPDIEYSETFEEFFGEAADFYRWDWNGKPEGNKFPVRIVLRKDEPGLPEMEVTRTYAVTKTAKGFAVKRVAADGK